MLLRIREILDPDLQLSPALRDELHAADRAHNLAIARRWWSLAALAQGLVVLSVSRASASTPLEARWLLGVQRIDTALFVAYTALFLVARIDRGSMRAFHRHLGEVACGVVLFGYATLGVNAQLVTGVVAFFVAFVMVLPLVMRVRVHVYAAMATLSGSLLIAGVVALQRSPVLRSMNVVQVVVITGYALVNARLFRTVKVRELQHRAKLERFNEELSARVAEKTRDIKALATRLDDVIESERRRLARDIHDDLGQELTALHLEIEAQRAFVRDERGSEALTRMADGVQRAHVAVRAILESLRPRILDEEGFEASIHWLVERAQERTGWTCTAEVALDGAIDDAVALVAFRITQEALTNAARHARASKVDVSIVSDASWLSIRVCDDGVRGAETFVPGRGLTGMLERALSVGGEFSVEAQGATGTCVRARLPLRTSRPSPSQTR